MGDARLATSGQRSRVGQKLAMLRHRHELSQEAVAKAAGMTVSQVNRIERGRIANPGYNTVKAIVERGIGASMSELEKEE